MIAAVRISLFLKLLQSLTAAADQNGWIVGGVPVEGGRGVGVSRDASFHGGSNGNISGYVRLQLSSHDGSLIGL
jgi:hypothetical protein